MINANRYRHTGRTYVNISRASEYCCARYLGLTPQAMDLSRLRRSTTPPAAVFEPRSGGIFIAWGVSPRNVGREKFISREAATDNRKEDGCGSWSPSHHAVRRARLADSAVVVG